MAAVCGASSARPTSPASDAVVGVGGGTVTDLAGFVAATWLRGVARRARADDPARRWSTPPSAARPASTPPRARTSSAPSTRRPAVLCDLDVLATLPRGRPRRGVRRGRQGGLHRRPGDPRPRRGRPGRPRPRGRRPAHARAHRAGDRGQGRRRRRRTSRESGLREILNYGHTLGHAIEQAERYRWRHGAAVSIGMVFAAELARRAGRLSRRRRRPAPRRSSRRWACRRRYPAGRSTSCSRRCSATRSRAARPAALRRARRTSAGRCGSKGPTRPGCATPSTPSPPDLGSLGPRSDRSRARVPGIGLEAALRLWSVCPGGGGSAGMAVPRQRHPARSA